MSTSFRVSDSWLVRTFVLSSWISSPCASVHLFDFFERACQQKNVVSKSQVWHASLVFVSQFDATALFLPNPNVFLHCWLENRIEQRAAEKISLFRASSNLEFITFHDRQQSGALVSMQTFRKQMCCSLVEWFRRDLQIASCRIESNGVLKIDRCLPDVCSHSLHFRTMSLYAIRWSVVWIFWKPTKVKKIGSCRACCAVL